MEAKFTPMRRKVETRGIKKQKAVRIKVEREKRVVQK